MVEVSPCPRGCGTLYCDPCRRRGEPCKCAYHDHCACARIIEELWREDVGCGSSRVTARRSASPERKVTAFRSVCGLPCGGTCQGRCGEPEDHTWPCICTVCDFDYYDSDVSGESCVPCLNSNICCSRQKENSMVELGE